MIHASNNLIICIEKNKRKRKKRKKEKKVKKKRKKTNNKKGTKCPKVSVGINAYVLNSNLGCMNIWKTQLMGS